MAVAGLGLALSLKVMLPYAITIGVSGVLETLVSQAHGNNMQWLCGLNLNRHLLMVTAMFIPIGVILWNIEFILTSLGQQEAPAKYCQLYLRTAMPALYLNCVSLSLTIFLTAMENSLVPMIVQAALITLHLFYTFLIEVVLEQGFLGIAYASNCTHICTVAIFWAYFKGWFSVRGDPDYRKILRPINKEVFRNINVFI